MKTDCEVMEIFDPYPIRVGDSEILCQQVLVRDYEPCTSTFVIYIWQEHNINYYNLKVGDKLSIEFSMMAKKCKDGSMRNVQIKLITATKHKDNWQPKNCQDDLYIIENCDTEQLKIGRSRNVQARLKQLQTSSGAELRIVHIYKGKGYLEKAIHDELKECGFHIRGEWFSNDVDVYVIIEQYIED